MTLCVQYKENVHMFCKGFIKSISFCAELLHAASECV